MTVTWRPLALAAALIVTLAAAATAQTVIVTKTPPGTSVSLGVNASTVKSGTADANGVTTLPLDVLAARGSKTGKTEMDVRVFVDVCEKVRHVWLTQTGWQPPAIEAGCTRHELFGLFALQKGTSLVIDAAEQNQAVWIRQGQPPANWLDPNAKPDSSGGPSWPMATGLVLFGGAGIGKYANSSAIACGVGADCTASNLQATFRVGGDFWFGRFLAATGSYLKPLHMQARGSGGGYSFLTTLSPNIGTIGAKVGLPAGRVRLYGEVGGVYQRSNFQTTQTNDPRTVTVNGQDTTFPGGTQVFNLQTSGWSWMVGGGGEIWVKRRWAIYGEVGRTGIKGSPVAGGEGQLDESLWYIVAGVKMRLTK